MYNPAFWSFNVNVIYKASQELGSLLRDLIPELILSQKLHVHMGPIRNDSRIEFLNYIK